MYRYRGFTLIELMIAVAIVAILVAVAYPSYTDQVTKTRRAEGKVAATKMAATMERCFTIGNAYNNAACDAAASTTNSENNHYTISVTREATSFSVSATPNGGQASQDAGCGTLMLNQIGQKTVSGPKNASDCW